MVGSPQFDKITIRTSAEGPEFVIDVEGNASDAYYVQSAELNGEKLDNCWFYRDVLTKGGTIKLTMGTQPNEMWGVETPPAISKE